VKFSPKVEIFDEVRTEGPPHHLLNLLNFSPLMSLYRETLAALTENASQVSRGDLLLEVGSGLTIPLDSMDDLRFSTGQKSVLNLIHQAKQEEKEHGVFPLCLSEYLLKWQHGKNELQTPLILHPCVYSLDKVHSVVTIELKEGYGFVNPVLLRLLKNEFNLNLSDKPEEFVTALESSGVGEIEKSFLLGNFHHHRFDILRDLEALQHLEPTAGLQVLMGDQEKSSEQSTVEFAPSLLEPCDPDQLLALQALSEQNSVVEGPPGTGKSQVLTNILATVLSSGKQALVVSEKRVALEVLIKKMRIHGLDRYLFAATDSRQSREFLMELKENWLTLEANSPSEFIPHDSSSALMGGLQLYLDTLNSSEAVGGLSYSEFLLSSKGLDLEKGNFDSSLPSVKTWLSQASLVEKIYVSNAHEIVGHFHFGVLQKVHLQRIDVDLQNLLKELQRLSEILELKTWGDLLEAMKLAAASHYFSTDVYRKYAPLLKKDSPQQKKFLALRKRYLKQVAALDLLEPSTSNWKKKPSEEELLMLVESAQKTGFFSKNSFRRLWNTYSVLPAEQALSATEKRKKQLEHEIALKLCRQELLELDIDQPEINVELIYRQIHEFPFEAQGKLEGWPAEKRKQLSQSNKALLDLHTQLKLFIQFDEGLVLAEVLNRSVQKLPQLLELFMPCPEYTEQVHRALLKYPTFKEFNAAVFYTNYQQFLLRFPFMRDLQPNDLLNKIDKMSLAQSLEAKSLAQQIHELQRGIFESYQQLLRTPSGKLTAEKKEFKERLKRGKAILVKAFAKKRNVPALRSLYHSEANEWIRILKPVWLCNPSQVARIFPMEKELFAFGIFDEASQIPLENALGTIYRSSRIVVAGDSQQMPPSSFFKAGSKERIDLLHQSSFHWKSVPLKHHYRSEHPGLIEFSNKHFYQSGLKAFPSQTSEPRPVELCLIDGVYDGGVNLKEAEQVAKKFEFLLGSSLSVGVVAFSQTQLEAIHSFLSSNSRRILDERMEQDSVFFKSLENVQGDECDVMIVSLGYGKDLEGKFHLRFGPLSQSGGDKRLNVLFSRSRKKIYVFTSVKSSEFKLSSNEGAELLRRYLLAAENDEYSAVNEAFFEKHGITRNEGELLISAPQKTFPNALELVTVVRVLRQRGWNLKLEF
jgi:hypothetical protein